MGSVDRYIAGVVVAALTAIAVLAGAAGVEHVSALEILVLAVGVAVAERVELEFRFERAVALFGLVEAAVICGLLLLPIGAALAGITSGMVLAQLTRQLGTRRTVFNIANGWLATSGAAAVVGLDPQVAPYVAGRSVAVALLAMLVYTAINVVVMHGMMGRVADEETRRNLRDQLPLTAVTTLGTTTVGILLAALVELRPAIVPLLLGPAAAVYLAARGATRNAELLTTVRTDRDRLNGVVDGASDGIFLLDRAGRVQVWNPAMERLTGISERDATRRPIAEVLTDDRRDAPTPVRGRWLMDGTTPSAAPREHAARLHHRDGSVRAVQESHALVFDERGRCTGDVVVVRDVTRQEELERLRSDFVARVSHELRTPLTPIRGFARVLLRRDGELTAEQRTEALERIVERADHLGAMVEDLLLVTRVDGGEVEGLVRTRPEDLRDTIAVAVARIRDLHPTRAITLDVAEDTGLALADPTRTGQIVEALLDNACRYSPPDTGIELELDQSGDDVRIRVKDHGPGIPADQREAVFQRFHRLEDPMTMRTSGVGLGLFLASRLASAMRGRLELEDGPPGGGATFVLHLPAAVRVEDA